MRPRSPLQHYQQLVDRGDFIPDPAQAEAAAALDRVWHQLQRRPRSALLGRLQRRPTPGARGLYIWGGVGRGKTWLMDLFFEQLPLRNKQRIHFHRFMQRVHGKLAELGRRRDPLPQIASQWARKASVLCLDEFFVSDIADAMLIAGLLENLFQQGVTLVTTSNIEPEELYREGLQRSKFLPAIGMIRQHMDVLELAGSTDYRLRILEQSEIFHFPLDAAAERNMTDSFERMAADCELDHRLEINGREFRAFRRGDGIIWFDFDELCTKPRGAIDFIEIARAFNTVFLSGVPQLGGDSPDEARRFITLVDEFYDRNVKLLLSAEVAVEDLYVGARLEFEFRRTLSRLIEMQSHEYLSRPHLP